MEKVIRKYNTLDEMKADEYRDWQEMPVHERMNAVAEISLAAYQMKEPTRMFDDFKELLSIYNARKVRYLIVGGYAVSFHAQPRATKDIDFLIKPDPDNGKAVISRLRNSAHHLKD